MLAWIRNLDDAASEVGSGPVNPGAVGYQRKLVGIGRIVVLGVALYELVRALLPRG